MLAVLDLRLALMTTRSQESKRCAFTRLAREEQDVWLRSIARRRFPRLEADDLVQEAWVRLLDRDPAVPVRHLRAFLFRVVTNLAIDKQRQERTRNVVEAEIAFLRGPAENGSQAEVALAKQVILSLPQPLRDVFVLSRLGGLTNDQIADHLGIRPKTVEWRMTKALAHCAAQFRR